MKNMTHNQRKGLRLLFAAAHDEDISTQMEYELNLEKMREPQGSASFKMGLRGMKALAQDGYAPAAATMADFLLRHPQYSLSGYDRQAYAWIAQLGGLEQPHHLADLQEFEWPELQKTLMHLELNPDFINSLYHFCQSWSAPDTFTDRCA